MPIAAQVRVVPASAPVIASRLEAQAREFYDDLRKNIRPIGRVPD